VVGRDVVGSQRGKRRDRAPDRRSLTTNVIGKILDVYGSEKK
jgi:hypothetical protein